jgi:polysaccharide export outer membrane protein
MYKRQAFFSLVTAFVLIMAPLASFGQSTLNAPSALGSLGSDETTYRIKPNDILDISVVGESDLSKIVTVLPDGTIAYPYVGSLKVAGMTVSEINRRLTAKLATQLVEPKVTVAINKREDNFVNVLGVVKTPGKVALKADWRVLDVLAASGGLTVDRPEWVRATLVRSGGEAIPLDMSQLMTDADPKNNLPVQNGDILLFKQRETNQTQVQILGQVVKQGAYPTPDDGSIVSLIAAAGGVTPQAALAGAVIRRGSQEIPIDLGPILQQEREKGSPTVSGTTAGKASPSEVTIAHLKPGDTLFVPENLKRFAVLGGVTKPGAIVYPEGKSIDVLEAISLAGGQTRGAVLSDVTLLRGAMNQTDAGAVAAKVKPVKLDLTNKVDKPSKKGKSPAKSPLSLTLNPGDVLVIREKDTTPLAWRDLIYIIPALSSITRR